jgi:hypothetical protein
MSYIYIMVEEQTDQEKPLISQYDKNDCQYGLEEICFKDRNSTDLKVTYNTVFIFDLEKNAAKAKEFLKRCFDNPLDSITLDTSKITIQTRISQQTVK